MHLNDLAKRAHECAKAKGFLSPPKTFVEQCMLVITEIVEAVEAHRNKDHPEKLPTSKIDQGLVAEELADAMIRIIGLGYAFGMDFEKAVYDKIVVNEQRVRKHGKAY